MSEYITLAQTSMWKNKIKRICYYRDIQNFNKRNIGIWIVFRNNKISIVIRAVNLFALSEGNNKDNANFDFLYRN